MTGAGFVRARSAEQRAVRRSAILSSAAEMLASGRVAELSLNELARRVGLAKSNVLRYFESREAVLLELLDLEYGAWLDAAEAALSSTRAADARPAAAGVGAGIEELSEVLADTVVERPLLAELLANSALVLEHNVSGEVAARYKGRSLAHADRLVQLVETRTGALPGPSRIAVAGAVNLVVGGAWSLCRPSPGMRAAYEAHPELQALRLDYRLAIRELLATTFTGIVHRPVSADVVSPAVNQEAPARQALPPTT